MANNFCVFTWQESIAVALIKENFAICRNITEKAFSLDKMIYGTLWALFDFKLCLNDEDDDDEENFYLQWRKSHFQSRIRENEEKVHLRVIGNPIINQNCFSAGEMK